ncbi:MAG: protein kinase [Myxococcales bacterium]|nr:protein kinase [Myxococcales bacterium]
MPLLTDQERLGSTLAEKYRLDRIVGRGGMGVVFAATHLWTGRPVAVKLLHPEYARDTGLVKRFLREARAAAGLRHPNVVDVLDMGAEPDGTVYLVLEMLVGESVDQVLEAQTRLSLDDVSAWLLPVIDAVAVAHNQGIVHRDLKPENIYLHRPSPGVTVPKLLDFGIAKIKGTSGTQQTAVGSVIGTLHYMSPEQAEGRDDVAAASDVWALGVVLYECLTGAMPFDGANGPAILLAISRGGYRSVRVLRPELNARVIEVIERCLSLSVEARYPNAGALAEALRAALAAAEIEAPTRFQGAPRAETPMPRVIDATASTLPDATVPDRPPRRLVPVVAALVAALVLAAVALSVRGNPSAASVSTEVVTVSARVPPAVTPLRRVEVVAAAPALVAPTVDGGAPAHPPPALATPVVEPAPGPRVVTPRRGGPRPSGGPPELAAGHVGAPALPVLPEPSAPSHPTRPAQTGSSSELAREW